MRSDRVLITGISGFIGSHLARRLVESGRSVVGWVRPSSNLWRLHDVEERIKILRANLDLVSTEKFLRELEGVGIIYHLAASGVNPAAGENPSDLVQFNIISTLRMLDAARRLAVNRFIYCGSCFEYPSGDQLREDLLPEPVSEYAASKTAGCLLAQSYHRRYSLPVVIVRPFTAFGPYESPYRLIPYTILRAIDSAPLELTGGDQERDFIFIDDLIDAFLAAESVPEAVGSIFNVCTGVAYSVKEVVSSIVALTGSRSQVQFGSCPYRDTEKWKMSGDPSRAGEILGWRAKTSFQDGLEKSVAWFRSHRSWPVFRTKS